MNYEESQQLNRNHREINRIALIFKERIHLILCNEIKRWVNTSLEGAGYPLEEWEQIFHGDTK